MTVIKARERLIMSILWLSTRLECTFRSVSDLLQHKLENNSKMGIKLYANTFFLKNASTLEIVRIFAGAGPKFSATGILDRVPVEGPVTASSRCLVASRH